jgi:hypothetical protein
MSILPDESLNRILGWIERGVKTQAERREQRELYKTLSNEYAIATQRGLSWLSLWLLAGTVLCHHLGRVVDVADEAAAQRTQAARRRIDAESLLQISASVDRIVSPTRRMSLGGTTRASVSSCSAPPTKNVRCVRFSTWSGSLHT